jgi:hypothetical protein
VESDDADAMRKANENLGQVMQKIGGAMYGEGSPESPGPSADDKAGPPPEEAGSTEGTGSPEGTASTEGTGPAEGTSPQ